MQHFIRRWLPVLALAAALAAPQAFAQERDGRGGEASAVARGEYVFRASGGCSCHTVEAEGAVPLAGGRALKTPFGTFYSTNITPHETDGLGTWSEADFVRAMRQGVGPDGKHYFPVFPYTSFTGMTDRDLADLFAYLMRNAPVAQRNRPPDALPPFGWRVGVPLWKSFNFTPQQFQPDPERSDAWNRGAYLVRHVAHCGECHTPRNLMGATRESMYLAGSAQGPEGEVAPNITPHEEDGIGQWSRADLTWLLRTGLLPNGDGTEGLMSRVIDEGYSHLSDDDLDAIATYVFSVPPIAHEVRKPRDTADSTAGN